FFQAEDGIRDFHVTGVQTCALPIFGHGIQFETDEVYGPSGASQIARTIRTVQWPVANERVTHEPTRKGSGLIRGLEKAVRAKGEIGRAACREGGEVRAAGGAATGKT